jgi:hypothetical protein
MGGDGVGGMVSDEPEPESEEPESTLCSASSATMLELLSKLKLSYEGKDWKRHDEG